MKNIRLSFDIAGLVSLIFVGNAALFHPEPAIQATSAATHSRQPSRTAELLIRYERKGGLLQPAGTQLPEYSLYGDGEIIWTEDGPPTPGFTRQVWSGRLTNDQILQLMNFAETIGFWRLANSYQPSPRVSADSKVITLDPEAMPDQLSATLTVRWKEREKRVVVYPAGWNGAPDAFRVLTDRVLQTRPAGRHEFQPQSFFVTVRKVAANNQHSAAWPFANIDLARTQADRVKLTREQGLAVAGVLKSGPPIVVQSGQSFSVQLFADPPREP